MKKILKYGLLVVIVALLGYNSVYIKKLSDVNASKGAQFNAAGFAAQLWNQKLPAKSDSAVAISVLKGAIDDNAGAAFDKYTNALAIGNYRYALVKGIAVIDAITADDLKITIQSAAPFKATVAMEFIYGNALRDASGLVNLQEFPNTSDLNSISEELNKIVRQKIIPAARPMLKPGAKIEFTGAVELNKEHIHFDDVEIIPISIKPIS